MSKNDNQFKSGFITLIGRPNVGKSTLLNRLVGQQISITADKPQTTRNRIRGIVSAKNYQAVILDTPGIHLPRNELHRRIIGYATQSIQDTDLIFFLTEPLTKRNHDIHAEDRLVLNHLQKVSRKVILLINKIDLNSHAEILETISILNQAFPFQETVPISALLGKGTDILKDFFLKYLPEGIPYFPEDQVTDIPERIIAGELVREQIIRNCFHEVPYGVAVLVEAFKELKDLIKIYVTIYVEKNTHKKIIIGKNGSMLKKVGQNSRLKMERMLGNKVFLSLHVKIAKNWINNPKKLSEFGYSSNK